MTITTIITTTPITYTKNQLSNTTLSDILLELNPPAAEEREDLEDYFTTIILPLYINKTLHIISAETGEILHKITITNKNIYTNILELLPELHSYISQKFLMEVA